MVVSFDKVSSDNMITNQPSDAIKPETGHKLFFALWPDTDTRAALARLQPLAPGRPIAPAKLHLTLAFLGHQPSSALAPLLDILHSLALPSPPLAMQVDCLGYFQRPRIAWAGMAHVPAALVALQAELMEKLAAAGFSPATHGAFKPHVTLARDAPHAPPHTRFTAVPWLADQAALVASLPDGSYAPIARQGTGMA